MVLRAGLDVMEKTVNLCLSRKSYPDRLARSSVTRLRHVGSFTQQINILSFTRPEYTFVAPQSVMHMSAG